MENNIIIRQGLKEFTANDIDLIQDVVKRFPRLSRNELAKTLCEHLNWVSPSGASKVKGCLTLLERLAEQDLAVLPDKLPHGRLTPDKTPSLTQRTLEKPLMKGVLKDFTPIRLQILHDKESVQLWNEYVQRYHPLKFQRPERLLNAIASLQEAQREVALLHLEMGFSVSEIANITQINPETAKSRLRYALKKIRQQVES